MATTRRKRQREEEEEGKEGEVEENGLLQKKSRVLPAWAVAAQNVAGGDSANSLDNCGSSLPSDEGEVDEKKEGSGEGQKRGEKGREGGEEDEGVDDKADCFGRCDAEGCGRLAYFENGGTQCRGGVCERMRNRQVHVLCGACGRRVARRCMQQLLDGTSAHGYYLACEVEDENRASGTCGRVWSYFDAFRVTQSVFAHISPPLSRHTQHHILARLRQNHLMLHP